MLVVIVLEEREDENPTRGSTNANDRSLIKVF
jgi:hypothetical protein